MARRSHVRTVRKNVTLTEVSENRIQRIRDFTNSQTDAEALRLVLDAYDELMTRQMDGYEVVLEPSDASGGKRPKTFRDLYDGFAFEAHRAKHGV